MKSMFQVFQDTLRKRRVVVESEQNLDPGVKLMKGRVVTRESRVLVVPRCDPGTDLSIQIVFTMEEADERHHTMAYNTYVALKQFLKEQVSHDLLKKYASRWEENPSAFSIILFSYDHLFGHTMDLSDIGNPFVIEEG